MRSSFQCTVSVLFIVAIQSLETTASPQDDPAYQLFAMQVLWEQQNAETKLTTARDIFANTASTVNLLEFNVINSTLYNCFESVKDQHPFADTFCSEAVERDVQQTVSDSENELVACSNLTRSWELAGQLLEEANEALVNLNGTVNLMLKDALSCVTRYSRNQVLKTKCLQTVSRSYNSRWEDSLSLAHKAYYQISGGDLLMTAEMSSCQNAKELLFDTLCNTIVAEFESNCLLPTTTITGSTTVHTPAPIVSSTHEPTSPETTVSSTHEPTTPETTVSSTHEPTSPETSVSSSHEPTSPETSVSSSHEPTSPETTISSTHEPTSPKTTVSSTHEPTSPETTVSSTHEPTSPETSVSSTHEPTSPETTISSTHEPTTPETTVSSKTNPKHSTKTTREHKTTTPRAEGL